MGSIAGLAVLVTRPVRAALRAGSPGLGIAVALAAGACTGAGAGGGGDDDGPGPATGVTIGFGSAAATVWEGTGTWPIDVQASAAPASAIIVDYVVTGTATAAAGLTSGSLVIAAGQSSARILVPIGDDTAPEPPQTVQIALVPPDGVSLGAIASATLTIVDNDDPRWPGDAAVATADAAGTFGKNLSGLAYQPATADQAAVLWAVKNDPSTLYRVVAAGALWAPSPADGWAAGKALHYPGGGGSPDAEGVTRAEPESSAVYVSTERDNSVGGTSRLSVLRFDTQGTPAALTATHEWNLTGDLPAVDPNLGLEAITWVPDSVLVAQGFVDASVAAPYDPARYSGHGTGLFLVGLEANGMIYAYALDHVAGGFHRIAAFASGHPAVMGLSFDRDTGYLWTACDDTCEGELAVLAIETNPLSPDHGRFVRRRTSARPPGMANLNNEDIAIVPDTECSGGTKPMFWTDDSGTDGHALRVGLMPCGPAL